MFVYVWDPVLGHEKAGAPHGRVAWGSREEDRGPNQVKLHPQAVPIGDYFYRGDTCPWAEARAKAARARAAES